MKKFFLKKDDKLEVSNEALNLYKKNYYSQDGEDVVLYSFYEANPEYKGFYVDIGALHPFRFSNTQLFYEKGWRGINIDATPGSMKEFEKYRPEDINIEIGISNEAKDLIFYSFKEPALNSFNKEISKERISKGWELDKEIIVKTQSINDVLAKYISSNKTIDFLTIDVEGLDFEILQSLDWMKYAPKFLLVEELNYVNKDIIGYEKSDMYQFLNSMGYVIIGRTKRTLIFGKI